MKLINNLYELISIDVDNDVANVALCPENIIYQAHFPEQPVTPGVCIIQIASELLAILKNKTLALTEIQNAKFLSVINPTVLKNISYAFQKITVDELDNSIKTNVVVTSGEIVCAKLSLRYKVL